MGLTQRERNELFERIVAAGLDMAGLDFDYDDSNAEVRHRATGSYFIVVDGSKVGSHRLRWAVADGPHWNDRVKDITWMEVRGWAGEWATEVRYITRDLWEELKQVPAAGMNHARNTPFTADERAEIARRVEAIKQQARDTPELTAEQIAGIEHQLDYLVDASKRVGPKDLLVMLYGTAFAMIVNHMVPAHVVQGVVTSVMTGLGHLLGLGGMPPSLPPHS